MCTRFLLVLRQSRVRAIWLVYRTYTNVPGFWLVKRTLGWKNFMPEELSRNPFDVILQHGWSIDQSLLHIRVFFGGKKKNPCSILFIHWLIKQITTTYRNNFSRTYENRSISSHQEPIMLTFQNGVWRGEMNMYLSYMSRSHGRSTILCACGT